LFLFIFESIGTSELILIGIVALIFLGPRKMPEMARKIGKLMAEFRTTTQDFKSTWAKEVNFEEETKALDIDLLERESIDEKSRENAQLTEDKIGTPEIKHIDKESFDRLAAESATKQTEETVENSEPEAVDLLSDKRNWL
jgi:Tat protein translocase TatB subunit